MVYLRFAAMTVSLLVMAACTNTGPHAATASVNRNASVAKTTCVTQTASRIPRDPSDCDGFGRSYSREDIERTGATTAGAALRLMDPGLTIGP
jgi:hypothetical protein